MSEKCNQMGANYPKITKGEWKLPMVTQSLKEYRERNQSSRTRFLKKKKQTKSKTFNPFTPRVSYGNIEVILTFESVDEILWCDHSNETSSAVLSHVTIYI